LNWVTKINESELSILLKNDSLIQLKGADNPDALRGVGLVFLVLDEFADIKPEAWEEVLRPALSDLGGHALFLGTPKGWNWAKTLFDRASSPTEPDWGAWQYTTIDGGYVDESEIESARKDLDPQTFSQEYLATFESFDGQAYYPFSRAEHCCEIEYDPKQPLIICFDFNIAPGVAVYVQERDITYVIGEVCIRRNSNTAAICRKIISDYGKKHQGIVYLYGDATGGAKGSAKIAGSDWDIIRDMLMPVFGERLFFNVPHENPRERVRVNAVNARLKNASGEIRLKFSNAPKTVADFEGVRLLSGGSGEIDKKFAPELTHLSDALGYYIAKKYPMASNDGVIEVMGY
jgi:hypothetical protein